MPSSSDVADFSGIFQSAGEVSPHAVKCHFFEALVLVQYCMVKMDLKLKGITWVRNFSQKFEEVCQEVDGTVGQVLTFVLFFLFAFFLKLSAKFPFTKNNFQLSTYQFALSLLSVASVGL